MHYSKPLYAYDAIMLSSKLQYVRVYDTLLYQTELNTTQSESPPQAQESATGGVRV